MGRLGVRSVVGVVWVVRARRCSWITNTRPVVTVHDVMFGSVRERRAEGENKGGGAE